MEFMQATQSTLQANTQAIETLEVQMGQLVTLISEMEEEETFQSQPSVNPIGHFDIEASSHNEQADLSTPVGNDKIMNIYIGKPLEIDFMDDDGSIQMSGDLVSDFIAPSSSVVPLEECLAQCDLDFDDDSPIKKVNALLNSSLDIATTEFSPDAKMTYPHGTIEIRKLSNGIDFYDDAYIRENARLDFIPLMDVMNKSANIKLFDDDKCTYNLPKESPIFDIKHWPP